MKKSTTKKNFRILDSFLAKIVLCLNADIFTMLVLLWWDTFTSSRDWLRLRCENGRRPPRRSPKISFKSCTSEKKFSNALWTTRCSSKASALGQKLGHLSIFHFFANSVSKVVKTTMELFLKYLLHFKEQRAEKNFGKRNRKKKFCCYVTSEDVTLSNPKSHPSMIKRFPRLFQRWMIKAVIYWRRHHFF